MLLDREAKFETVELDSGRAPNFIGSRVATNHQAGSSWPIYEEKVFTHARFEHLHEVTAGSKHTAYAFSREFLKPPLYQTRFARGFGTLYDAAFYPQRNACEYFWPENNWQFNFQNFSARDYHIAFIDPEGYPAKSRAYGEIYTSQSLPVLQF
jgi:hypothetical protein